MAERVIRRWSHDNLRVANVLAEARGEVEKCGVRALEAVDWVVYHRTQRRPWPDNARDVILQRAQFSWTRPQDPNYRWVLGAIGSSVFRLAGADADWMEIRMRARQWEGYHTRYPEEPSIDPTNGADHYLNVRLVRKIYKAVPKWASDDAKITAIIGNHTFFNLRGDRV